MLSLWRVVEFIVFGLGWVKLVRHFLILFAALLLAVEESQKKGLGVRYLFKNRAGLLFKDATRKACK